MKKDWWLSSLLLRGGLAPSLSHFTRTHTHTHTHTHPKTCFLSLCVYTHTFHRVFSPWDKNRPFFFKEKGRSWAIPFSIFILDEMLLFLFFRKYLNSGLPTFLKRIWTAAGVGLKKMLNFASNSRSPCPYFYVFWGKQFLPPLPFFLYTHSKKQQLNKFFVFFIESAVELGRKFPVVINNGALTHTLLFWQKLWFNDYS